LATATCTATPTWTPTITPPVTSTATRAAAATQPSGLTGAGARLPNTGTGQPAGGTDASWFALAISALGLASIGGAVVWRKRA
jgi:hypothetical protein